jgi:hypothetical protein
MRRVISFEFESENPVPAEAFRLLVAGFLIEEVGVLQDSIVVTSSDDRQHAALALPVPEPQSYN